MQEGIPLIFEVAHIPVFRATQFLESLIRTGVPSRGEVTDPAMAAHAESVMLNKGPFIFEAINELDLLFGRMGDHIRPKTHQLKPLRSWHR